MRRHGLPSDAQDAEQKSDMTGSSPRHNRLDAVRQVETGELSAITSPRKLGLPFILNDAPAVPLWTTPGFSTSLATSDTPLELTKQLERTCSIENTTEEKDSRIKATGSTPARPQSTPISDKKRGRMCKAEGCTNYIVHKGLCCRHGGGKKCSVEGCESSAKHGGRCWKHGGSINCKIEGCTKKAKAKGLCWGHGGGAKCQAEGCAKVAISNGSCWAHGGGKRCIYDGCQRPAFERTHSFCLRHFNELQDANYYEV